MPNGPPPLVLGWHNVAIMIVLGLMAMLYLIFLRYAQRGRLFKVRRLSQLDAIEEMAGRATEMNKCFLAIPIGLAGVKPQQLAIYRAVAKACAVNRSTLYYVIPQDAGADIPWFAELSSQEYLSSGTPRLWQSEENIHVLPKADAFRMGLIWWMQTYKPAAVLAYTTEYIPWDWSLLDESNKLGAISFSCANELRHMSEAALYDYSMFSEENSVAAAYLSGDVKQMNALIGEDIVKYGIIIFMLIAAIGGLLGLSIELTGIWG